jgi:hypothetical protein
MKGSDVQDRTLSQGQPHVKVKKEGYYQIKKALSDIAGNVLMMR